MAALQNKSSAPSESGAALRIEPRTPQSTSLGPGKGRAGAVALHTWRLLAIFADLCDAMLPDDRVSQCLDKLYSATTLPLTFQLPGVDADKSKERPDLPGAGLRLVENAPEQTARGIVGWISLANCALLHVDGWRIHDETGPALPDCQMLVAPALETRPPERLGRARRHVGERLLRHGAGGIPRRREWVILLNGSSWRAIAQARGHNVALFWLLKQYDQSLTGQTRASAMVKEPTSQHPTT